MDYREHEGMLGHPIPLISAEGELTIWFKPRMGARADLIFQFSNPILTGNVAGLQTFMRVPWRKALEFASGLMQPETGVFARLSRGEGVVLGQQYGPIKLELNPMCYQVAYLTPSDVETIAHVVAECCVQATGRREVQKFWQGVSVASKQGEKK